jgi:hypothetical protein
MLETKYGEIVFDRAGRAVGVIYIIEPCQAVEGRFWRVIYFGALKKTHLVSSREDAEMWFRKSMGIE